MRAKTFHFGDWTVHRAACTLVRGGDDAPLAIEPRAMDVLTALCDRPGEILSAEDLLRLCWDGLNVGENQVHKAIAQLRRAFGDSANEPRYIENIRKRGYRTIAPVSLDEDDAAPAPDSWSQGSPYVGLDPFDAGHAGLFFGRNAAVSRLVETVATQIARQRALVLVLGPSGSGKTSLIQAGLIPALHRGGRAGVLVAEVTLDLGDIGQSTPLTAIGSALLDWEIDGQPVLAGRNAEEIGDGIAAGRELELSVLRQAASTRPDGKFLLFIDRLEALFDGGAVDEAQKSAFLTALDRLARSGTALIVLACRNDFYPSVAKEALLMEGKASGGHFDLEPPTRGEISQMIRLPAQAAGLTFGTDPETGESLADHLCDAAAHSPDALPLLQYTLHELYFQRSPNRELTSAAYRALGGIDGAIGKRAEAALSSLPDAAQASLFRILPLIVQIDADDGLVRSRRASWSALDNMEDRAVVRALVDQRLFVSLGYEGSSLFGVAHEALLRQWPRVVEWIAEHRQALRTRSRLEASAQQWVAEGRRRDLLLPRGKPVDEARDLARHREIPLTVETASFIEASARRVRRGDYLRVGALASFGAIAVVAVVLGLRANHAEVIASQRRLEADDLMNYMVGDFVDKLRPLGRLDLLDGAAQKSLSYLTGEDVKSLPNQTRLQQAKALQTLAEVSRSRGNASAAAQALNQANRLLQANLALGPEDNELLKTLGAVSFWLGQIALDQGRLDEAQSKFGQYRDYAQRMNTNAPDAEGAEIELSYALSSLGSVAHKTGNEEEAAKNFAASIALKQRALQKRPDDRALQAELANSLSWLANTKASLGELAAALEFFDQQRVILEALNREESGAALWSFRLSLAVQKIGTMLAAQGKTDDSLMQFGKSLNLIDSALAIEPKNSSWQEEKIWLDLQIIREGRFSNIDKKIYEKLDSDIRDVIRMLSVDENNDTLKNTLAISYLLQAQHLSDEKHYEEAMVYAEKSKKILIELNKKGTNYKYSASELSNLSIIESDISKNIGDTENSINICKNSILNLRPIAQFSKDFRVLDPWIRSNICYGNVNDVAKDIIFLRKSGYKKDDYMRYLNEKLGDRYE